MNMRNKRLPAVLALALAATATVWGQNIYDASALAEKDLSGTARFVGMGGAMGALGGDISTMGTNPAGIGLYRSNDLMFSLGLSAYGTKSQFGNDVINKNKLRFSFDNIGAVFSSKIGNLTALRYLNFGFNYRKSKSLYKNMEMGGALGKSSQTYLMAAQADGITNWQGDGYNNPYENPNIGWLSVLGYDAYLITPTTADPSKYLGMVDGGDSFFRTKERGGVDAFDFNVALNLSDRVYLGLTLGAYAVDYSKNTLYSEAYGSEGYTLQGWNRIEGSGFDLKFGAIFRPVESSPFRIGVAVHTPTFYDLKYLTSAYINSDVLDASNTLKNHTIRTWEQLSGNGDMEHAFRLQTPWTFQTSVGHVIGQSLALGTEYEYKDYSTMKLRDTGGYADAFGHENNSMSLLKGVHTLRLGVEYKVIPRLALRAGYNYSTAIFKENAHKLLAINSIHTDTDYTNSKDLNVFTTGVGYRGSSFYADLAYKFSVYKSDFHPFVNTESVNGELVVYPGQKTKLTDTRSYFVATCGFRF